MKKQITKYYCDICGKQCRRDDKILELEFRPGDGRDVGPSYLICNCKAHIPYSGTEESHVCEKCIKEILMKHYLKKDSLVKSFGYIVDEQFSEEHIQAIADIVNFTNDCEESEDEIFAFAKYLKRKYGQEETADCLPDELIDCKEKENNVEADSDRNADTNK